MVRLLIVLVTLGASASALAVEPAPGARDPLLEELVREALEKSPEYARARATVAAERERVPQAGALADPTLSLGIQNDGFKEIQIGKMDTSYFQIMVTQPLPWPGKRGARERAARAQASAVEAQLARVRLSTTADVERGYVDLLLVRGQLELLAKLEALWKHAEATARIRYEVGGGTQSDLVRSDAEARSPELSQAQLATAAAERRVEEARRERYPDLSVTAGIMPRGGLEPMWLASVAVTLPVFDGRKGSRAVAEVGNRRDAEAAGSDATRQVVVLRARQRHAVAGALVRTNAIYQGALLVQSDAAVRSTLSQYKVGKVTFAAVLDVLRGLVADEGGYLESLAQAQRIAIAAREVSLDAPSGVGGGGATGAVPGAGAMGGAGAKGAASEPAAPSGGGAAGSGM
jgi:cobalt-zinc-cadmium efflux system outer membrane protein